MPLTYCTTTDLEIAYEQSGPPDGFPIILLHGFPDDPRTWDDVARPLAQRGFRTITPWLRGYGPTRFLAGNGAISGQQAALGKDLLDLMDALHLREAGLVGYDWGGRAACIVSALRPDRVRWLVSIGGYHIQDIANAGRPADPAQEHRFWYQWYFGTERGRLGLDQNRYALCRLLWTLWSPKLAFSEETYATTAASFDNPAFVDVVIHCYRHRYGLAAGTPALEAIERQLSTLPVIPVPTIVLHGGTDGCKPTEDSEGHGRFFTGPYQRRIIGHAGHILSREAPDAVLDAIADLCGEPRA